MAWIDDYSVSFSTGAIRHTGGTTRYPVIDMHRALMTLVHQATKSGDDLGDITDLFVPSKRNSDTDIELLGVMNVDLTAVQFMYGGSITYDSGDEVYSGIALAGVFSTDTQPQLWQNNSKVTSYWGYSYSPDAGLGYACRLLIKSRTAGADIDGGRIRGQSRGYGYQFRFGRTVLGRNEAVCSIGAIAEDTFNSVLLATIATYTNIVNTEGYQTIDYNNGNGATPFYMNWTKATRAKLDVYNRIKYETREASAETLYGITGENFLGITHYIPVGTPTGTMVEPESLSWGTGATAGTGQLLAIDSTTAGTKLWIQLLTGVAPASALVITGAGAGTVTATSDATEKALGAESVAGNYTGAWITCLGAGMAIADVGASDSLLNLLGAAQSPPNNQNVVATGMVAAQDRIIIGKSIDSGVSINKSEYAAAATGNGSGSPSINVKTAITNVPAAGWVRISNGVGEDLYPYSSYSGTVFTLDSVTLTQAYAENADVYPTIIDKVAASSQESNTWVYTADTWLAGQVVDAGASPTKAFPIAGQFVDSGFSVNVVRTPDE
jgi:hypothetical protein